jgi:hypothetical protein
MHISSIAPLLVIFLKMLMRQDDARKIKQTHSHTHHIAGIALNQVALNQFRARRLYHPHAFRTCHFPP